ncbi:hypothetical protein [Micromonospora sp. NPDC049102]
MVEHEGADIAQETAAGAEREPGVDEVFGGDDAPFVQVGELLREGAYA